MSPARGAGHICMIIVTGHLTVDARERSTYLETCVDVVRQARATPGCLDFAVSPDIVDPRRVNVLERWSSREQLDAFRTGGPSGEQQSMLEEIRVGEYETP